MFWWGKVLFLLLFFLKVEAIELSRRQVLAGSAAVVISSHVLISPQQASTYLADRTAELASERNFLDLLTRQNIDLRILPNFCFTDFLKKVEIQLAANPDLLRQIRPEYYSVAEYEARMQNPKTRQRLIEVSAIDQTNQEWSLHVADIIARAENRLAKKLNLPLAWVEDESTFLRNLNNYRPEYDEYQGQWFARNNGKPLRTRKYPALGLEFMDLFIDELYSEHPHFARQIQWNLFWRMSNWDKDPNTLHWFNLYKEPNAKMPQREWELRSSHTKVDELWELRQIRLGRSNAQTHIAAEIPTKILKPTVEIAIQHAQVTNPVLSRSVTLSKDLIKIGARLCTDYLTRTLNVLNIEEPITETNLLNPPTDK